MNENNQKIVQIPTLFKGKRILVFLADFFLSFIFAFVLFNAMAMPISNAITSSNERNSRNDIAAKRQFEVLYDNKVLLYQDINSKYNYVENVEYTLNCYLSYYSFEDTDSLEGYPQYGHKEENEVVKHFYYDIRNSSSVYLDNLLKFNSTYDYYIIEGNNISLKDNVKTNLKLSFFSPNDMSEDGKTILANMQNNFMNLYADVFKDIEKNDLLSGDISYLKNKAIVSQCENELQWQLVISSSISYFLSVVISFLIIPLFNKDNRTLGMMMMRITRIGTNNLYLLKKSETILNFVYMLVFNLPIIFFMPMTYVVFTYLFNLPVLPALLFIGLILNLASFLSIMFSPLNRSISDYLSQSVLIKNSDLDEIYRSKGYDI